MPRAALQANTIFALNFPVELELARVRTETTNAMDRGYILAAQERNYTTNAMDRSIIQNARDRVYVHTSSLIPRPTP